MAELVEIRKLDDDSPSKTTSKNQTEQASETYIDESKSLAWPVEEDNSEPGITNSGEYNTQILQKAQTKQKQRLITKNIIVICIVFLLIFTVYNNLKDLININQDEENGEVRIIQTFIIHATTIVGLLFVAPWMVLNLKCKVSIAVSIVPFIIHTVSHFYPHLGFLVPCGIVLGLGSGLLWTSLGVYITQTAVIISSSSGEPREKTIFAYFGIFFMVFYTAHAWSGLISAFILQGIPDVILPQTDDLKNTSACGSFFCPLPARNITMHSSSLPKIKVYTLLGTFTLMGVLALISVILCLSKIQSLISKSPKQTTDEPTRIEISDDIIGEERRVIYDCRQFLIFASIYQMTTRQQVCLIPLTIYSGLQQGFFMLDFSQSYIECSLGYWMVSLVTVCWAFVAAITSVSLGHLIKISGRIPIFSLGALLQCGLLLALFLWKPQPYVFPIFVIAGLWGISDCVWQCLLNGLYGVLFWEKDKEAAFANYHLWRNVGLIIAFITSHYFCSYIRIFTLLCTLILGMAGYFVVEVPIYRQQGTR